MGGPHSNKTGWVNRLKWIKQGVYRRLDANFGRAKKRRVTIQRVQWTDNLGFLVLAPQVHNNLFFSSGFRQPSF